MLINFENDQEIKKVWHKKLYPLKWSFTKIEDVKGTVYFRINK